VLDEYADRNQQLLAAAQEAELGREEAEALAESCKTDRDATRHL
jgi:hypothetical protein